MKSIFDNPPSTIIVDARSLQDPDYRYRGVGQHSAVILEALRFQDWSADRPKLVALTDTRLEPLAEEHALLFDEIVTSSWQTGHRTAFLSLSPMTHSPLWLSKYLLDKSIFKISLFYDLIQLQFPERYLPTMDAQLGFMLNLAWLKTYDCFAAISKSTGQDLENTLNIPKEKIFISYVAVRRSLEPESSALLPKFDSRKYILFAGGGDPRKNPECAVIAHANSKKLQQAGIKLVMFGNYQQETRSLLRKIYANISESVQNLIFLNHLSDKDLKSQYANALMTVVSSRAEGFSIPIVESNAAGTPVIASNVGAHPELLPDPSHRFDPEDPNDLREKLETFCLDEKTWLSAKKSQTDLWSSYTVEKVGRAFLNGFAQAYSPLAIPAVQTVKARPSLSLLSPLPPASSGVADYSEATFRALSRKADLHVYTETRNVSPKPWFYSLSPIMQASFTARRQDATVVVLGNSHFHTAEFEYLMNNDCAVIAHDARMINFYVGLQGIDRAIEIASKEYGRIVDEGTVREWLINQDQLPILFMSEIVRQAKPLMVHSPSTAEIISKQYNTSPILLPFAQYNGFDITDANTRTRLAFRQELGWAQDDIAICTFGHVSDDKAPDVLVWVIKLLNDWKIPAKLHFCGPAHGATGIRINSLIDELHLRSCVFIPDEFVPVELYRKYIFAADVGIQLRTYFMGGLSGALNDCIAAALPSVANEHLAEAMLAPSFVRRVPDKLSPILIAEAILDVIESGQNKSRPVEEASNCAQERSVDRYADNLLSALGL